MRRKTIWLGPRILSRIIALHTQFWGVEGDQLLEGKEGVPRQELKKTRAPDLAPLASTGTDCLAIST